MIGDTVEILIQCNERERKKYRDIEYKKLKEVVAVNS